MKVLNKTFLLCTLSWLILSTHCCLDPAEPANRCTQCNATQVLVDARCYDKLKGCLTYKSVNSTSVSCTACQNGYTIIVDHCQRKAVVDLANGNPTVNNPPPVAVDNPGTLKINVSTNTPPSSKPDTPKSLTLPVLPQPTFVPFLTAANNSISISESLSPELTGGVYSKYSRLSNYKPVLQLFNSNASQFPQKSLVVFEDGTILNIQTDSCSQDSKSKSQSSNANNKDNLRTDNADQSSTPGHSSLDSLIINELYRPTSTSASEPQLTPFAKLKQELAKANVEILSRSLTINYEVRLANKTHATLNMDLLTGQVRAVSTENANAAYSVLSKTSESPKYTSYVRWAYAQFLESARVANPSELIESTEIQRTENASQVLLRFVYNSSLTDATSSAPNKTSEYALLKYDTDKNSTQVVGYFMEGVNILNLFKSNTTVDKPSINNTLTNNTPNISANLNNNQGDVKKPMLGVSTLPSALNKANTTTPTGPTIPSTIPTSASTPSEAPESKYVSMFASPADYLAYLSKRQQFSAIASRGFKMVSMPSAQSLVLASPLVHRLKLMTPVGIYAITILEVPLTHELSQTYQLQSPESCLVFPPAELDPVVNKLDIYLKKTYSTLQSYPKMVSMNGLTDSAEKYYLVYANEGMKKIMFEVTKKSNLPSYAISRSQIYNNGYFFASKGFEAINLKMWEYNDEDFISQLESLKILKPLLNELLLRYKTYVSNSILVSALANATHAKLYLTNKFATFEFTRRLDEEGKGEFILLEQKLGKDVLPVGFKKDCLLKSDENGDLKIIEDQLIKKYRTYFGGGGLELFYQKCQSPSLIPSVNCFDVALKTVLGYFTLTANQPSSEPLQLSALKKVSSVAQQPQIVVCRPGEVLDANDKRCYWIIRGCYLQVGSICVMCDVEYIAAGRKQCKKACAW